jgi:hypothetical protein
LWVRGGIPANVIFETTENEANSVLGLPFVTIE